MEKSSSHVNPDMGKEQGHQVGKYQRTLVISSRFESGSSEPSPKQTHVVSAPQIPEIVRQSAEYAAQCLLTNYLEHLLTEDVFPTVDEFLISSDAMLSYLASFGVSKDAWEELAEKILTNLKEIESLLHQQNQTFSEYDSKINNEKKELIKFLKDVQNREKKRTRSESYQRLVERTKQLDKELEKAAEKERMLLEKKRLVSLEMEKMIASPTNSGGCKRRKTT